MRIFESPKDHLIDMDSKRNRRHFLISAGTSTLGILATVPAWATPPIASHPGKPVLDGEAALKRLLDGNARYVLGKPLHTHESGHWRRHLTDIQKPFAAILGCSDSRVPPELVFDQGLGDLFVIRVAGNVVSMDVIGSLQYAGAHLHVPLLVVLGHKGCGAVTAALEAIRGKAKEPRYIEALTRLIQPGIAQIDDRLSWNVQVDMAVKANVHWTMKQLREIPEAKIALESGRVKMVGALYDLESGRVSLL